MDLVWIRPGTCLAPPQPFGPHFCFMFLAFLFFLFLPLVQPLCLIVPLPGAKGWKGMVKLLPYRAWDMKP